MFNELNVGKKWDEPYEGKEYIKLREYLDTNGFDTEITVYGYFINDLDNGKACTIIAKDYMINMPAHAVKVFEGMTKEQDQAINEGKLVLKNFKVLKTKYKNETVVYDYCDK